MRSQLPVASQHRMASGRSRVGIVVALDCEQRSLTGRSAPLGDMFETSAGHLVGVSGPGVGPAMALASRLLELRVDHLMSWGLAGALVAHLKPGAVILPTTLVGSDHRRHTVHAGWWEDTLESLGKSGPVSRESLAESRSALVYRAHKQALHAATNAVAVDMESVGVARVAEAAGVPFLCVRVIVDSLDHDIPAWISDHLDRSGGVKPAVLIRRAVRAPRDWGALLVLSLALARALNRLHRVAPLILGNGHPTRPPNIPSKRYP